MGSPHQTGVSTSNGAARSAERRRALSPGTAAESLSRRLAAIVTDGRSTSPSGQPQGRGALAVQEAGVNSSLHFADAAAWRDYAEAYGNPDVYAVMMHHIHGLTVIGGWNVPAETRAPPSNG